MTLISLKPIARSFMLAVALVPLLTGAPAASAQTLTGSGANGNPYNSPIKRANPNSRQGTVPATPAPRPGSAPAVRSPSLENGGIGNGQPTRQAVPVRPTLDPHTPTPGSSPNARQPQRGQ